ncbi:OB-fold domain-containing protein [Novosphingobium sp. 11B]
MTMENGLANGDSSSFWNAAAHGRLEFQKCGACGHVQFPPRHQCATCWEVDLQPLESAGKGTVESFTIVRRAPLAEFRDKVPYAIASIRVQEGPRMITNILGNDALTVEIGDPVVVEFGQDANGRTLPQFRLARPRVELTD